MSSGVIHTVALGPRCRCDRDQGQRPGFADFCNVAIALVRTEQPLPNTALVRLPSKALVRACDGGGGSAIRYYFV